MENLKKIKDGIYYKVDWISLVYTDCSLSDVLKDLCLIDIIDFDDFVSSQFMRNLGYFDTCVFVYEGIQFSLLDFWKYKDNFDLSDLDSLLSMTIPRIKVDISGSALDFLRSILPDIDWDNIFRQDVCFRHVTRMDYAFDLINYMPTFLDDVVSFIRTNVSGEYLTFCSQKAPIGYSIRSGDQKTLYIGRAASDKLLRIYDKKMQFCKNGVYVKDTPYGSPDSWIRIEFQTRSKFSHDFACTPRTPEQIFKYLYDKYSFAVYDDSGKKSVAKFWLDLFDWSEIPSVIQNIHFCVKPITVKERVENICIRNSGNLFLFCAMYGFDSLKRLINKYILELFIVEGNEFRSQSFLSKSISCDVSFESNPYIEISDGIPQLK